MRRRCRRRWRRLRRRWRNTSTNRFAVGAKILAMKRVLFLFIMIYFLAAQSVTETEITSEPSHHLVSDEWGGVRVFRVEVGPHAATVLHRHRRDYVSVTLSNAHILNEVEGKPPVDLNLNDGDTRF